MEVTIYEIASSSNAARSRVLSPEEYEVESESFETAGTKTVTTVYHGVGSDGQEEAFYDSFTVEVIEALENGSLYNRN